MNRRSIHTQERQAEKTPLEAFAVLDTLDGEELRAVLEPKAMAVDIPSHVRGPRMRARINAAHLPRAYVAYLHYGAEVSIAAPGQRPDFNLSLALSGGFDVSIGARSFHGGLGRATLASPNHDQTTLLGEDSKRLGVWMTHAAMVEHLESLLGETLSAPLEFDPSLPLDTPAGRRIQATVREFVDSMEQASPAGGGDLFQFHLESRLMDCVLRDAAHNYSERLQRRAVAPAPRTIRRAVDYLEAHASTPLRLADLVQATGVPGRTLNEHFRRATGVSPLSYLRRIRLARVRTELKRAHRQESVGQVAARWGFAHAGRFSAEYRQVYGESPSQTLRRRPAR